MLLPFMLFILGLIITIKCGDMFVDSAVWIANKTGVPRLLIGATIVSLGTTLPELFVSAIATSQGATGMGIGNAIGSAIFNTSFILAISIIALPSAVARNEMRGKAGLMIYSAAILLIVSKSGVISKSGAVPLLMITAAFLFLNVASVKKSKEIITVEFITRTERGSTAINIIKFICGAIGISIGANLMVDNGVLLAIALGVSEAFVGITMVAMGTSLPELVTTLSAIRRKEAAIGIGNIIGANILDLTLVLSVSTFISKNGLTIERIQTPFFSNKINQTLLIDLPVCIAAFCIAFLPTMVSGRFRRWQGISLLLLYSLYMTFLLMEIST
jgi:cation:H+ antiporter